MAFGNVLVLPLGSLPIYAFGFLFLEINQFKNTAGQYARVTALPPIVRAKPEKKKLFLESFFQGMSLSLLNMEELD